MAHFLVPEQEVKQKCAQDCQQEFKRNRFHVSLFMVFNRIFTAIIPAGQACFSAPANAYNLRSALHGKAHVQKKIISSL
jgi:hypothetical protein